MTSQRSTYAAGDHPHATCTSLSFLCLPPSPPPFSPIFPSFLLFSFLFPFSNVCTSSRFVSSVPSSFSSSSSSSSSSSFSSSSAHVEVVSALYVYKKCLHMTWKYVSFCDDKGEILFRGEKVDSHWFDFQSSGFISRYMHSSSWNCFFIFRVSLFFICTFQNSQSSDSNWYETRNVLYQFFKITSIKLSSWSHNLFYIARIIKNSSVPMDPTFSTSSLLLFILSLLFFLFPQVLLPSSSSFFFLFALTHSFSAPLIGPVPLLRIYELTRLYKWPRCSFLGQRVARGSSFFEGVVFPRRLSVSRAPPLARVDAARTNVIIKNGLQYIAS